MFRPMLTRRSRPLAWAAAGLLLATGAARAGDADTELKALLEKQAKLIEEQGKEIQNLRRRLDNLTDRPGAPPASAGASKSGDAGEGPDTDDGGVIAPDAKGDDKKGAGKLPPIDPDAVKKIVADYVKEDKKKDAEEARKKEDEERRKKEADGTVVGSVLGMNARWDNGLWVETPDKAFRFHPNGRLQFDVVGAGAPRNVQFGRGGIGPFQDAVNFRRARIGADGTFWEVVSFDFQLDFTNTADVDPNATTPLIQQTNRAINTPVPTDAWLQISELPVIGHLRGGNIKPPLALEHLQSSRFLDFLERSYAFDAFVEHGNNGFYPGFQAFDNFGPDDRGTWGACLYRNTRNIFGWNVEDGDWATAGRVTYLPWYESDGRYLVHLGVSGMSGDLDQDINRWRARPLVRNGNAVLHNVVALGRVVGEHEYMVIPEFAANVGPFGLQAEYYAAWTTGVTRVTDSYSTFSPLQKNLTLSPRTYFGQGGYVEGLYFLTEEHRQYQKLYGIFTRVVPYRNFYCVHGEGGRCSSPGAWQVGLRYSWLDLNNAGIDGGTLNDLTVGLNWFLNPNAKVQWNYCYGYRTAPAGTANGDYQTVGMRLAFDF